MAEQWTFPNGEVVTVNEPYYPASCDKCGWQGSSEACGTDSWGDDSDVFCPTCHQSGADCGKAGEAALKSTAASAQARSAELEKWQASAIRSARIHDENIREFDNRATAAEARADRLAKALERVKAQLWESPPRSDVAIARIIATEALQQEG